MDTLELDQWRISRLQVFNWGTFSNIHDIPVSEKGFLFVGASGSGKSTLLDAMITLLFPNPAYNAAAREGEQRRGDRSLLTYVRGAWSNQTDTDATGVTRTKVQYLRPKATFSAAALTLGNLTGDVVTLMLVAAIRKSSNEEAAVNRQYFIIKGAYSFNTEDFSGFKNSGFDWRWLKARLPEHSFFTTFNAYKDAFCERFGIEDKEVLRLLAKAQSAKNLGDLNTFLRNFMLEEPPTIDTSERLVVEFQALKDAHAAVKTAREQRDVLAAARNHWHDWNAGRNALELLDGERIALPWWRRRTELGLEEKELPALTRAIESAAAAARAGIERRDAADALVQSLQLLKSESGGLAIERLEFNLKQLKGELGTIGKREAIARKDCATLGNDFPAGADDWNAFTAGLAARLPEEEAAKQRLEEEQIELGGAVKEKTRIFRETVEEIESMRARPSNIPSRKLKLRAALARDLGVSEEEIPFVGELIEVKASEAPWKGAIERVLHGFALSILVDDALYPRFTELLESRNIGDRLVYYRVREPRRDFDGFFRPRSIPTKLSFLEGRWEKWLAADLAARFSYLCAENLDEFRRADQAVTRAGQVKHSAERHEKDDRTRVDDPMNWVTGFSNKEKLALFEERARTLGEEIAGMERRAAELRTGIEAAVERRNAAKELIGITWDEIDTEGCRRRIAAVEGELEEMRRKNLELQEIERKLGAARAELERLREEEGRLRSAENDARNEFKKAGERIDRIRSRLAGMERDVAEGRSPAPVEERITAAGDRATESGSVIVTLSALDDLERAALEAITAETRRKSLETNVAQGNVTKQFALYLSRWEAAKADLDDSIESAPEFFAILDEIIADGLPKHEANFRRILDGQSLQGFAELNVELRTAKKDIHERMREVNASLRSVPFSRLAEGDTHLFIKVVPTQNAEAAEFAADLERLLQGSLNEVSEEANEARFSLIAGLIEKLRPGNPETERWRRTVLDVRNHVSFTAYELNDEGTPIETYESGSGKSGGQRQKLTTTCLAAALRYKLGASSTGLPVFAPVILDEAFDKADSDFTDLSMNIFNRFGFQMIVATPEKSVVTLEPYIGGAFYVVMRDRMYSSGLCVRYDDRASKLDFSDLYVPEHVENPPEEEASAAEFKARRKPRTEKAPEEPREPDPDLFG